MNSTRLLVGALMFSLGLNAVLVGMGLSGRSQPAPKPAPAPASQFKWSWTNLFPIDEPKLKLTDEQKAQLDQIRRRVDDEELRLGGQTVERWQRWTAVLMSDQVTTATIEACVAEMTRGTEDLMLRSARSIAAQRAIMTPEQKQVFEEILKWRMKRIVNNYQKIKDDLRGRMTRQYGADYMRSIGVEPTTGTLARK